MSEDDMIKVLLNQLIHIGSIKKVFMKKRDIKVYDESLKNIMELRTEYDLEIVAKMINPVEWRLIVALEKMFGQKYPKCKFNYNLIEFDPNIANHILVPNGKLIYDSESIFNMDKLQN